jgi:formamidopyrimidine-DNA glycosylase
MPELPEAERARVALEGHTLGRVVADADDSDSFVCRPWPPGGLREALVGHKVTGVDRVGKQLLIETDGPVLGLHLGMSGSLRFDDDPALRFKRFALAFTDGGNMVLRDPRRLGRVTLDPARGRLGPDAMQVSLARFRDLVGRSRAPVKARLLNQQALAGIGNLLADEALWRAGIDPRRLGVEVDPAAARVDPGPPQSLVGQQVAHPGKRLLVEQAGLDRGPAAPDQVPEPVQRYLEGVRPQPRAWSSCG